MEISVKDAIAILQLHGLTKSEAHITDQIKTGKVSAEKRYNAHKLTTGNKTRWYINLDSFLSWAVDRYKFTVNHVDIKEYVLDKIAI